MRRGRRGCPGRSTPRPDRTAGLLAVEWPDLDAIGGLELPGTMQRAGGGDATRAEDVLRDVVTVLRER